MKNRKERSIEEIQSLITQLNGLVCEFMKEEFQFQRIPKEMGFHSQELVELADSLDELDYLICNVAWVLRLYIRLEERE